ncbi:hypothetical protein N9L68_02375 [bacterium]|nr:hypothetical protein [bacterium]
MCTGCGSYGHTSCLRVEYFKGHPWCVARFATTAHAFAAMQHGHGREQRVGTFPEQSKFWKRTAREGMTELQRDGAPPTYAEATTSAARNSLRIPFSSSGEWACLPQ